MPLRNRRSGDPVTGAEPAADWIIAGIQRKTDQEAAWSVFAMFCLMIRELKERLRVEFDGIGDPFIRARLQSLHSLLFG